MFTEIYIEALLVDEDLADQVWELWHEGVITDTEATGARMVGLIESGLNAEPWAVQEIARAIDE